MGVFLQSHDRGIHGVPLTWILGPLKGLLDSGVCLCRRDVYVLVGPCDRVFCPYGHGLRVQVGPFGQVFCPYGHGLGVLGDDGGEVGACGICRLFLNGHDGACVELSSGNV